MHTGETTSPRSRFSRTKKAPTLTLPDPQGFFGSLRHSAVTMLKAAGLSDFFAREIVGHDTAAVSRHYTHLSTDDLRAAMQRLPDVTTS